MYARNGTAYHGLTFSITGLTREGQLPECVISKVVYNAFAKLPGFVVASRTFIEPHSQPSKLDEKKSNQSQVRAYHHFPVATSTTNAGKSVLKNAQIHV